MIIPFDELNLPERNSYQDKTDKKVFLDDFFDVIPFHKEERIRIAEEIDDAILTMYELFYMLRPFDTNIVQKALQDDLRNIIYRNGYYNQEMEDYVISLSELIVLTTLKHSSEPYFFSEDRAIDIGANESLTIMNYRELHDAIDEGYTYKTWWTMEDNRVRETHEEVDGVTIPIEDKFQVGEHLLAMPHDYNMMDIAPEEIVNCRCYMTYS